MRKLVIGYFVFKDIPVNKGAFTIEEDTSKIEGYTPIIKEADLNIETEEVKAENATKIAFDNGIPKSIRQDFSIQIPKTIEEEYTLSTVFENKKIKEATKPVKQETTETTKE